MKLKRIVTAALGGAFTGAALALSPRLGLFSEVRNFQIFLLETSYQRLRLWLPGETLRLLGTSGGEIFLLTLIGAMIGALSGFFLYGLLDRAGRFRKIGPFFAGAAAAGGISVFLFGILWCRIVFIHSASQRMISPEGFLMLAGSLAAGVFVWVALAFLFRLLSRYRLEKFFLIGIFLLLLVNYLGFPFEREAVSASPGTAPPIKQVVVLGGDGATWDVALPLIREGKLPNLERLMKEGSWGDIRATLPWKSPVLWTSMATGKRKEEHGINDFVARDPVTHEVGPSSISARKVKAIWDMVSEAGRRVSVASWYAGWPAEPLNGTMVSDRFLSQDLGERVYPPERLPEIEKLLQEIDEAEQHRDERLNAKAGIYLMERDRPDLLLIYLREIDDMQHFFWRYHAARRGSWLGKLLYGPLDPKELEVKGTRVEDAYQRLDETLGKIMKRAGAETVVIVVSDHGAGIKALGEMRFSLNPLFEKWELLHFSPGGKKPDWTRTKVYDATKRAWYEDREFFVNKRPEGPFAGGLPEAAERELLESAIEKLKALRSPSGKAVVTKAEIRRGEGRSLYGLARMNVRLKEEGDVTAPGTRLPLARILWHTDLSGTHRLNGLIAIAGPGIKAGHRLRAASILDLTPTLLYLLDLPVAEDMEGRPLLEAVEDRRREAKPLRSIATYETGEKRRSPSSLSSNQAADEELLEKLQSLGYIQ